MRPDKPFIPSDRRQNITLLRPDAPGSAGRGVSSAFPTDLFEQARGRLHVVGVVVVGQKPARVVGQAPAGNAGRVITLRRRAS